MTQTFSGVALQDTFARQNIRDAYARDQVWLDLLSRLYGYTPIQLTTRNAQDQVTGYLPLCTMQSPLTGRRLVSLPFTDECPLLAVDQASANALVDQAIDLARERRARYIELRAGSNEILANRAELVAGDLYVRWVMPLTAEPDQVWQGLRKPVQHQVKKARKLGVRAFVAQKREEVEHYYRLHLLTRSKKHGMPAQPRSYFYGLWDAYAAGGGMQLLLAEHEGNIIAGMILRASGDSIHYAYGASDERFLNLAPNNLLMWEAIALGCRQGYATFDFGRTARDNEGLMEFKRRWGAIQEPLIYYYYPHVQGLASTSEQSLKFRLLTTCWRRVPLRLAGPLGGYLYKHLG
jgi:FemAB-related protein (PEP-CTERM system-associated)